MVGLELIAGDDSRKKISMPSFRRSTQKPTGNCACSGLPAVPMLHIMILKRRAGTHGWFWRRNLADFAALLFR